MMDVTGLQSSDGSSVKISPAVFISASTPTLSQSTLNVLILLNLSKSTEIICTQVKSISV